MQGLRAGGAYPADRGADGADSAATEADSRQRAAQVQSAAHNIRGNDEEMQWPYGRWGATVVIAGHDHLYERLQQRGITYIVNGLGGRTEGLNPIHRFLVPVAGSKVRYNRDYGAMLVTADDMCINFSFYARDAELIDSFTLTKEADKFR